MQAITTKYLPPTEHRPSRVSASCAGGKITIAWDHGLNTDENQDAAARALLAHMAWNTELFPHVYRGTTKNGDNVYVFAAAPCRL